MTLAKEGKGTRALVDELLEMEAQEDSIRARLAAAPADVPDVHPNISEIYRRKAERLTHALSQPEERQEAADALRALIERFDLTPGAKRGEVNAVLYGEFGRILEWIEQRRLAENAESPGASASGLCGMSVSVVAGATLQRMLVEPVIDPLFQTGTQATLPISDAPETTGDNDDWRNYGNDAGGSRFSPLAQITPDNVDKLEVAWTYRFGPAPQGAPEKLQVTPIKVGDSLYACTAYNDIVSLDAETGR